MHDWLESPKCNWVVGVWAATHMSFSPGKEVYLSLFIHSLIVVRK